MSSSDSDYEEICDNVETIENAPFTKRIEARTNDHGLKIRGKDVEWVENHKFENMDGVFKFSNQNCNRK